LVAANRAVIETLTAGETDVDTIVTRTDIDEGMVRTVLADPRVFETSTFVDAPTMIVAAKLTHYGRTLARVARGGPLRIPNVRKTVHCPKCRKEHSISVPDESFLEPSEKTSMSPMICNGCCGFTVDQLGRVHP
jgi:hypothetical protein